MEKTSHVLNDILKITFFFLIPIICIILLLLLANTAYKSVVNNIQKMKDDKIDLKSISHKNIFVAERIIDLLFSVIYMFFICSWLFPIIGILIKLESGGPILYKCTIIGRKNKPIVIYRFNDTYMPKNFDKDMRDSLRLTKIGYFLRKSQLVSLPCIFNVFFGQMTIVGVDYRTMQTKYARNIELVRNNKPAMISLYSVISPDYKYDFEEAIQYDFYYVNNKSLALKAKIFLASVVVTYGLVSES
ncbi:MAG TPA: sugar transferase [Mucilaginibacter sp.]|nr:sugar transferase [Mucilaginibacter sp.]